MMCDHPLDAYDASSEPHRCQMCGRAFPNAEPRARIEDAAALRADRDRYVRLFNRLDAAISHHKAAERFPDDHDEALWAARDRILRAAATPDEPGKRGD